MGGSAMGGPQHGVLPFKLPMSGPNSLLAMWCNWAVRKTACSQDFNEILVQWVPDCDL